MTDLQIIFDFTMCIMWLWAYVFVLVGCIKYRYPMISPLGQAIIFSFELSVVLKIIVFEGFYLHYTTVIYFLWALVEVAILFAIIKTGFIKKRNIVPYIMFVLCLTIIMFYFVAIQNQMYFFSYFNTILGELIWLWFVFKNKKTATTLNLYAFIAKFIGDVISIFVYFGVGSLLSTIICVTLPFVDAVFFAIYFYHKKNNSIQKKVKESL